MIGTKLGPYEITAKLGEGGMGEVYRATDTKLKRDVALKVLPAVFVEERERLARFEREAQLLAQLHHPNIASIFGVEDSGGVRALIMELVEGPTLAERLAAGPIAAEDAVVIARQIADALEEAHEKGIVHRDLKPQNVKVDDAQRVKVLDFGLAKAMSAPEGAASAAALANSPTLTAAATTDGVILGTAAYMSPEQAKGRPVDKRADIWAFGVVLFEMLVGRRLFEAETLAETLGAIFRQEIDLEELPAETPRRLRRLLERCLERDPNQRLRDIGEARIALHGAGDADGAPEEPAPSERRGVSIPLAATLVAGAAVIGGFLVWGSTRSSPGGTASAPEVTELSVSVERLASLELSPDGRRLFWIAGRSGGADRALFVRDLDNHLPRELVRDPNLGLAFWSPDGSALAVSIGETLWRYSVAGGEATPICDFPRLDGVPSSFAIAGAWLRDDTIVFGAWRGGIFRVSPRGGAPELHVPIDPEIDVDFHSILELPGAAGLLLTAHREQEDVPTTMASGTRIEIYREGRRHPVALGEDLKDVGTLGFVRGILLVQHFGDDDKPIWGVPFDPERGVTTGQRFVVVPRAEEVSASSDGTLAWVAPREVSEIVERIDPSGAVIGALGKEHVGLSSPALSPDGSRMAMLVGRNELWVADLQRDTETRLVREDGAITGVEPQWTPDGRALYYTATGATRRLMRIRADPGAVAEAVLDDVYVASVAPEGRGVLFIKGDFRLGRGQGLWWAPLERDGRPGPPKYLIDGIGVFGRLSPDGSLLAYLRSEERRRDAYLTTFPALEPTIQLSASGARLEPRWSADGRSVFYVSGEHLVRVDVAVDAAGRLAASPEKRLFDLSERNLGLDDWSVGPDGSFLFVRRLASLDLAEIVVARHGLSRAIADRGATRP